MTGRPGQSATKDFSQQSLPLCSTFPKPLPLSVSCFLLSGCVWPHPRALGGGHSGKPLKCSPSICEGSSTAPWGLNGGILGMGQAGQRGGNVVGQRGGCLEVPPGVCLVGTMRNSCTISLLLGFSRLHVWRFELNPLRYSFRCQGMSGGNLLNLNFSKFPW